MSEFTLRDLLPRFDGWEVVSVVAHEDLVEVRAGDEVSGAPSGTQARGVLFVSAVVPEGPPPLVGSRVEVAAGNVKVGPWTIGDERLVAGQMLESAIVVVEDGRHDPVAEPGSTADTILESGMLVWPTIDDLPQEHRGLELLEGVTRIALGRPSLVTSVSIESDGDTVNWDTFLTPFGVVEVERRGEEDPMVVSYFPLFDVPSRLLERTGVARWVDPGGVSGARGQSVGVRSTFMDDAGLVASALEWQETEGGLVTSSGPLAPLAVASELLRMLPGGDVDLEAPGKEVVGER